MNHIPRVYVETPYSASNGHTIEENVEYARECMKDCLLRGEAPFLSHLLYTQYPNKGFVSDDDEKHQIVGRENAIKAGFSWASVADKTVVYTDYGISGGMKLGIDDAVGCGRVVEYRGIRPLMQA